MALLHVGVFVNYCLMRMCACVCVCVCMLCVCVCCVVCVCVVLCVCVCVCVCPSLHVYSFVSLGDLHSPSNSAGIPSTISKLVGASLSAWLRFGC